MKANAFPLMAVLSSITGATFSAEPDMVSCSPAQVGDRYEQVQKNPAELQQSFTISSVSSDTIEATTENGSTVVWDKSFNVIKARDGRTFSPKFQQVPDCPFKLGEKKTYQAASWPGRPGAMVTSRSSVITVDDRYETTKVPAGEFKTVRVIAILNYNWERSGRSGSGRITRTSYVTSDGIIVRTVNEDQDFSERSTQTWSVELTSLPKKVHGTGPEKSPLNQP